jgi:hypothetical protein
MRPLVIQLFFYLNSRRTVIFSYEYQTTNLIIFFRFLANIFKPIGEGLGFTCRSITFTSRELLDEICIDASSAVYSAANKVVFAFLGVGPVSSRFGEALSEKVDVHMEGRK